MLASLATAAYFYVVLNDTVQWWSIDMLTNWAVFGVVVVEAKKPSRKQSHLVHACPLTFRPSASEVATGWPRSGACLAQLTAFAAT